MILLSWKPSLSGVIWNFSSIQYFRWKLWIISHREWGLHDWLINLCCASFICSSSLIYIRFSVTVIDAFFASFFFRPTDVFTCVFIAGNWIFGKCYCFWVILQTLHWNCDLRWKKTMTSIRQERLWFLLHHYIKAFYRYMQSSTITHDELHIEE